MVTGFDIGIFLGVLLAMMISQMPKRFAMAVSLYASIGIMGVNGLIGSGDFLYWAIIGIESLCALILLDAVPELARYSDRFFFRLMAGMFCVSVIVHLSYLATAMSFAVYTHLWQVVAVLHVAVMLGYADGSRNLVRRLGIFGDHRTSRLPDH